MSSDVKSIADAAAAATAVGTVMEIIPSIAGIFTIVWLGIRIWESDTVQGLVGKIRKKDASEE
jgi:hypothetical protein